MESNGRIGSERGKRVWILETREGKLVDSFRTKKIAEETKKYYKQKYFWDLIIKREKRNLKNEGE